MANYNLWDMAGLDIFLQSLSDEERIIYSKEIEQKRYLSPLKSWEFSSEFYKPKTILELRQEDKVSLSLLANQFHWKTNLTKILAKNYDAIVITDFSQKIIWTNSGFFKMTGYSESYAIGKSPSFLQGDETSTETKLEIKEKLDSGQSFTEKIANYKIDQKMYWCEIEIFPMMANGKITHYLALETELK